MAFTRSPPTFISATTSAPDARARTTGEDMSVVNKGWNACPTTFAPAPSSTGMMSRTNALPSVMSATSRNQLFAPSASSGAGTARVIA